MCRWQIKSGCRTKQRGTDQNRQVYPVPRPTSCLHVCRAIVPQNTRPVDILPAPPCAPMNTSCRFFHCLRCRCQTHVCSHCDRGQVYCSGCGGAARADKVREAGKRYQASRKGGAAHAARAAVYRARLRAEGRAQNKVTHQGSPAAVAGVLLASNLAEQEKPPSLAVPAPASAPRCQFCGRACREAVRLGPLWRRVLRDPRKPDQKGTRNDNPP